MRDSERATPSAAQASKDPYTLRHYGEFHVALEGVRLLARHAAQQFDLAWNGKLNLGWRQ